MTRTETDLRDAMRELEQRADQQGAPSTAGILDATTEHQFGRRRDSASRRSSRWLAPLAAAAVVAAAAVTAVTISAHQSGSSHSRNHQAGGQSTSTRAHRAAAAPQHPAKPTRTTPTAATILDDAAAKLDAAPTWTTPAPQDFFYIRTTQATTWTSVSGRRAGHGRTNGATIPVPGCSHGRIVATGESGTCTLNDVPHYLGDAPTAPPAWDAYLERMAPGSKAADAQGKIIVAALHQDLVAPKAAAALLRYTATCPGLHTVPVRPVTGEKLIGVTCTSMTNGSFALVFDAASHAHVGFVVVTDKGHQDAPAEIVRQTGIVPAIGRRP